MLMPDHQYLHLQLAREEPITERRPGNPPHFSRPENPLEHGRNLLEQLAAAKVATISESIGGFDSRKLIKFEFIEIRPEELQLIPGVEVISQEGKSIALAFATDAALDIFESRLATLATGGQPTRRQLLYALQGVDVWSEEDRIGWALAHEGMPATLDFLLDIELWPLSNHQQHRQMTDQFERWLEEMEIPFLDRVRQPSLVLYRVRLTREQAGLLLKHRDVRTVDLPPKYGINQELIRIDIQEIPAPPPPPENAQSLAILDSGIAAGHPLLSIAFGDSQAFIPGVEDTGDETGHGTHIAGLALYGDVEQCMQARAFIPSIWIHSGKILDCYNENNSGFVHNHITEAVRYFRENYDCRVFNLSFGDKRKPYLGTHVKGLALTLDTLARTEEVLFVVSTGNFEGEEGFPADWLTDYPNYLLSDSARLLDPAPALNVVTVGSIARWDQTITNQRYPNHIEEVPIARSGQPSPFTRSGPSVNNAIKPEVVAYGGNYAVTARCGALIGRGLGELSVNKDFAAGRLWGEQSGTSYAAPHVAHLATRLLEAVPGASTDLVRALLIAHAKHPVACQTLLGDDATRLRRVCGYGQVQDDSLFRSREDEVTTYANDAIRNKNHHFYEIPIPDDFYSAGRRRRELTVALAYSPAVRTTRIDYRATKMSFKVVESAGLEEVSAAFSAATADDDFSAIGEFCPANRDIPETIRSKGTVQASTWVLKSISNARRHKKLFVVVTRNDPPWGGAISSELEAYSLVICLRDREAQNARLYTQMRAQLHVRTRARVRV